MGLSLKRRDNANINKIIYGGVLNILLEKNNIQESLRFLNKSIQDMLDGKFPLEEFVVTKTLRGHYKCPDRIVHKMLADRMALRDKGSAPQVNDRVPYAYIQIKEKKGVNILQGNRIEDPKYIIENNLKIDYEIYITNQIMNPILQLYSLVIEQLPNYKLPPNHFIKMKKRLIDNGYDEIKADNKIQKEKEKEVKNLLFSSYLNKLSNKKNDLRDITDFMIIHGPS